MRKGTQNYVGVLFGMAHKVSAVYKLTRHINWRGTQVGMVHKSLWHTSWRKQEISRPA